MCVFFFFTLQGKVEYVAVQAGKDECATPAKLVQNYVICKLDKKLDILLGFIKTHLKSKMIVFFTSCAQVSTFFCLFFVPPRERLSYYSLRALRSVPFSVRVLYL